MTAQSLNEAMLLALAAGATIPLGGALAAGQGVLKNWHQQEIRHTVTAFGGGALLSAVALVLVPEAIERLSAAAVLILFGVGGTMFALIDKRLASRGSQSAMLMAMMLDFLPEAMALGALLVSDWSAAILLTMMIALQNLPESFGAFRNILDVGTIKASRLLAIFALLALLGPAAAALGYLSLVDQSAVIGGVMVFSSGGILYIIFEDIAPQVPLEKTWLPPLGAVSGFMLGLAGYLALT